MKGLKPPQREIVQALRELVGTVAPGLVEGINPWGNPTWRGKGDVLWLIAYGNHTDLGFFRGTDLRDPEHLLEGTGKKFRHVKVRTPKDAGRAGLRDLIREAVALDAG